MQVEKKSEFDIDVGLRKAGEFGPYQCMVFVLVGLTALIPALMVYVSRIFIIFPDFFEVFLI
jgi:hypothetical protein